MILHKQKAKICNSNVQKDQIKLVTSEGKKKKGNVQKINPSLFTTLKHKK